MCQAPAACDEVEPASHNAQPHRSPAVQIIDNSSGEIAALIGSFPRRLRRGFSTTDCGRERLGLDSLSACTLKRPVRVKKKQTQYKFHGKEELRARTNEVKHWTKRRIKKLGRSLDNLEIRPVTTILAGSKRGRAFNKSYEIQSRCTKLMQ